MNNLIVFLLTDPWRVALAVATIVFGVGRLARIITYDTFPLSVWWRIKWATWTANPDGSDGPWTKLFTCFWCLSPWLMLGAGAWFVLGFLVPWIAFSWWLFWGWLALSYLAAMVVARDDPHD